MNPLLNLLNSSKSFTTNEHIEDVISGIDRPNEEFIKTLDQGYSANSIVGQAKHIIPVQLHMNCTIEVPMYDNYGTVLDYKDVPLSGISSIGSDIDISEISTYSNSNYLDNMSSVELSECTDPTVLQSYISNSNVQPIGNKCIGSLVAPDLNNTSMISVDGTTVSTIECSIKYMTNLCTVVDNETKIISPYTSVSCIDYTASNPICNSYLDGSIDALSECLINEANLILSKINGSYINLYMTKVAGCSEESLEISPYINKDAFSKIDECIDTEIKVPYLNMEIEGSPINQDVLPSYIDADKVINYINYLNSIDINDLIDSCFQYMYNTEGKDYIVSDLAKALNCTSNKDGLESYVSPFDEKFNKDNKSFYFKCTKDDASESNKSKFTNIANALNDTDTQTELEIYVSPFDEKFNKDNKSCYFKQTKDTADKVNSCRLTCIHECISKLGNLSGCTEFKYLDADYKCTNLANCESLVKTLNNIDTIDELEKYVSPFDKEFNKANKSCYFKQTKDTADSKNEDILTCIHKCINKLDTINENTEFSFDGLGVIHESTKGSTVNKNSSRFTSIADALNNTDTKDGLEKYVSPFDEKFNEDNKSFYFKCTKDTADSKNEDILNCIYGLSNTIGTDGEREKYVSPFDKEFNEDNKSRYFKCTKYSTDKDNRIKLYNLYNVLNRTDTIDELGKYVSPFEGDNSTCCSINCDTIGEPIKLVKTVKFRCNLIPDSFGYNEDNPFVSIVAGGTANSLNNFLNSPLIVCDKFKNVADNFLFDSTQLFSNLTGMGLNLATSGIGVNISRFDPYLDIARPGATLMPHAWLPSRPYDGIGKRWKPIASGFRDESCSSFYLYSTMDSFGNGKGDKTDLGIYDTCRKYSCFNEHYYIGMDNNGCIEQGCLAGKFNTYTRSTRIPTGHGESKYIELEGWEYKITMQSDIDPRTSYNESKSDYESKRFIGINTIREMTGMDIGTDFYWDLTFELIEDNIPYLPNLPFSSYSRAWTRSSSKSNGNKDYIPIISFNLNGGSSSTTSIDTLLGPVSVFGGYNLPSSISLQLYDDTYHELDLWLREYLACIFQINSSGNKSTRNDDKSIFILPYKQQCMYINIYLYDMQWNEIRRRSYIVIPNFDLRLDGTSDKSAKQVDLSFSIVGSRGNIKDSQVNVMDSDNFTGLNILD